MRVGRSPSMRDGGATWYGVIADTNAPEEDHWWAIMAGDVPIPEHLSREESLMLIKPDNWSFYNQPGGMTEIIKEKVLHGYEPNKLSENQKNLTPKYYENIVKGKTKSWIDVYVMNKYGTLEDGKLVYPSFKEEIHVAKETIPIANAPVVIGIDFGLTPAAVFGQRLPSGKWNIVGELVCFDMGISRFSDLLRVEINKRFGNLDIEIWGDPAGDFR